MTLRRSLISLTAFAIGAVAWADGAISDPTMVMTRTDDSFFWRTAFGSTVTLAWEFPEGATSADITVSGLHFEREWEDLTTNALEVVLQEPATDADEDVYTMTIAFDDGTVRTAKIGRVRGAGSDEGTTRVLADDAGKRWQRLPGTAVLPIPQGSSVISIDGQEVETGLEGAQGWFGLGALSGTTPVAVTFESVDGDLAALLYRPGGLMMLLR